MVDNMYQKSEEDPQWSPFRYIAWENMSLPIATFIVHLKELKYETFWGRFLFCEDWLVLKLH